MFGIAPVRSGVWVFRSHQPRGGGASDILQYSGLVCRNGNSQDRRLLSASALADSSCPRGGAAAASLALFVWLPTLHPTSADRVYAAYGGVYVATAVAWFWLIDGVRPTAWDLLGSATAVLGMAIIVLAPRG